jgi:hypothetical protein
MFSTWVLIFGLSIAQIYLTPKEQRQPKQLFPNLDRVFECN